MKEHEHKMLEMQLKSFAAKKLLGHAIAETLLRFNSM